MSLTLVTDLSDQYSNSYVDVAFCDEYWAQHWSESKTALWEGLAENQKVSLLIQACRSLETLRFTVTSDYDRPAHWQKDPASGLVVEVPDKGRPLKARWEQSLQFPRNIDRDAEDGEYFIPEAIQLAQCEQAVYLMQLDEAPLSAGLQGVSEETTEVGAISISQTFKGSGSALSPIALEYVRPFLLRTSATIRRG